MRVYTYICLLFAYVLGMLIGVGWNRSGKTVVTRDDVLCTGAAEFECGCLIGRTIQTHLLVKNQLDTPRSEFIRLCADLYSQALDDPSLQSTNLSKPQQESRDIIARVLRNEGR